MLDLTTRAYVDGGPLTSDAATVSADGSMRIAAGEQLDLDVIAGNLSVSGSASVGAAAAVPVVTKTTEAFVGAHSHVTALGQSGVTANTGALNVTTVDTRFRPETSGTETGAVNAASNVITLPYAHGFNEGDQVVYHAGGDVPIGGLTDGGVYYVHVVSPTQIQLQTKLKPIALGDPAEGTQTLKRGSDAADGLRRGDDQRRHDRLRRRARPQPPATRSSTAPPATRSSPACTTAAPTT